MISTTNKKQGTPLDLEYEIIKEESDWAGINFLWHPRFREYAKKRENMPFDYEAHYNDPQKQVERDEAQKKFALYTRQEPLGELLKRHPNKAEALSGLDPAAQMSEKEMLARYKHQLKQQGLNPNDVPDLDKPWLKERPTMRTLLGDDQTAGWNPAPAAGRTLLAQNTSGATTKNDGHPNMQSARQAGSPASSATELPGSENDDDLKANRRNRAETVLGPYWHTNRTELHQGVEKEVQIFHHISDSDQSNRAAALLGATTSDHGVWGNIASGINRRGSRRLIVYGDSETGKPTRWEVFEYKGTGKKQPNTNIEKNDWHKVSTVDEAVSHPGFWEGFMEFERRFQNNRQK